MVVIINSKNDFKHFLKLISEFDQYSFYKDWYENLNDDKFSILFYLSFTDMSIKHATELESLDVVD